MGKITLADLIGKSIYIDTNIFIYFFEQHEQYFDFSRDILMSCQNGTIGYTGDAVLSELLVKPIREKHLHFIDQLHIFFEQSDLLTLLPHDRKVFEEAARLRAISGIKFADALHLATAITA